MCTPKGLPTGLGLQSCHHRNLDRSTWRRSHLPGSQQIHHLWHESALQLILNCRAVTTVNWIPPCHYRATFYDRSKCTFSALNLLHTLQAILDCRAVTTAVWIAPCQHRAIFQDCGKRTFRSLNLLDILSWSCTAKLSAPHSGLLHVTTEPSSRMAANASSVAWICWTFLSWCWTAELSPRQGGPPHVTTEPASRIAANALFVAWICWTSVNWSCTAKLSPPYSGSPQVTTEPSRRIAANAVPVAWEQYLGP